MVKQDKKREPLFRLWFLSRGYKQADPRYTKGRPVWLHPIGYVQLWPELAKETEKRTKKD